MHPFCFALPRMMTLVSRPSIMVLSSLIAIVVITAVTLVGTNLTTQFDAIATAL
jgi:hypothetical protein